MYMALGPFDSEDLNDRLQRLQAEALRIASQQYAEEQYKKHKAEMELQAHASKMGLSSSIASYSSSTGNWVDGSSYTTTTTAGSISGSYGVAIDIDDRGVKSKVKEYKEAEFVDLDKL